MELDSWRQGEAMREPLTYLVNSLSKSAPVFLELVERFRSDFERAGTILELGAGQGWASCIVKSRFPEAHVIATDFSPDAIASIGTWERVFDVKADEARQASSYETGLPDELVDLVFAYASAHHFVLHRETLREIARIVRPGGTALYLYEPSVRNWIYPMARARIQRTRTDVVEDAINQDKLLVQAAAAGLGAELDLWPTMIGRGSLGVLYNAVLLKVPPLRRIAWCTANFRFTKLTPP